MVYKSLMNIFPDPKSVRLLQATYFDNGKPTYPVRGNKADGGKGKNTPQHMVTIAAWTGEGVELHNPDFTTNAILIPHRLFPKRMGTWLTKGTISQQYHDDLRVLTDEIDTRGQFEQDRTYYAPLFERGSGQRYIEGQFFVATIDAMDVTGHLFIDDFRFNLPTWSNTYPSGTELRGAARAMCRLDLVDFSPSWRTCTG